MAKDELLFESERLERRQQRKRLLLPLAIVGLLILAILAVIAILHSGKGETHMGGEDTPYPFRWTQAKDGSLRLELSHKDAAQERWQLQPGESFSSLEIQRAEKESGGSTVFHLTPNQPGRALLRLVLAPEGKTLSARYGFDLLTETVRTQEGLAVSILSAQGNSLVGEVSGGEEMNRPYRVYTDWNGDTVIAVENVGNSADWEFSAGDEEVLRFLGLHWADQRMEAHLLPGAKTGESSVLLKSESAGVSLELTLRRTEEGSLQVLSHQAQYRDVEESEIGSGEVYEVTAELPQTPETTAP
ncbi:MAG: hypothetical protein IKS05_00670 [Oscillospiraceae bacterium]|nr:hypothetical protein [Oscillospiraceae bacterium]